MKKIGLKIFNPYRDLVRETTQINDYQEKHVLQARHATRLIENKLINLTAEMRLPGRAWLQFELNEEGGMVNLRQTAIFDPAGIFGKLYWLAVYPAHQIVFKGLLKTIKKRVE